MSMPAPMPEGSSTATPIVFIVFNRPDCTARSLAAIRTARPGRLYVVADGPRADRAGEAARCAEVRALVEQGIDWPCEVTRDYAPANLGCARRVASGLDGVFARESEAIILEDDCVASPGFFAFCTEMLARYRDRPEIWQIGGANFQATAQPDTYYFSRYNHVWGWATWKRAWTQFAWEMKDWASVRETRWLRDEFEDAWAARYWRDALDLVGRGQADSWAYRWTYAMWRAGGLALLPGTNLVSNIGFGEDATHRDKGNAQVSRPATEMVFPLRHLDRIERNEAADRYTELTLYSGGWNGWLRRVASRLKRRFGS